MALPQSFTASRLSDATFGNLIDDRVGDLERAISDINGIPFETPIAAPGFLWDAGGLKKVIFQDNDADPAAAGEFTRRGTYLKFHDGVGVRINQTIETLTQASFAAVSNTAAETAFWIGGIVANTLGTRNRVEGTFLVRPSLKAGSHIIFFMYWGGVAAFTLVIANSTGVNVGAIPVVFNFGVFANGATNSQVVSAHAHILSVQSNINPLGALTTDIGAVNGAAVDSTLLKNIQINVSFSAADPLNNIDCLGGKLMVIG
jgi:hypothetical protein